MKAPLERSAQVECLECGLFVYWQAIDGMDTAIEMRAATREEMVAALLGGGNVPLFARGSVSEVSWFVWESPVSLARELVGGKTPPREIHLMHPHRVVPGRVARKPIHTTEEEAPF